MGYDGSGLGGLRLTPWPRIVSHLLWPRHIVQETAPGAFCGGRRYVSLGGHLSVWDGEGEKGAHVPRVEEGVKDLVVTRAGGPALALVRAQPRAREMTAQVDLSGAPRCVGRWRVRGGSVRRLLLCEWLEQAGCDCRGRKEAGEGRKRGTEATGNSRHPGIVTGCASCDTLIFTMARPKENSST
jgi:hypothetical protein